MFTITFSTALFGSLLSEGGLLLRHPICCPRGSHNPLKFQPIEPAKDTRACPSCFGKGQLEEVRIKHGIVRKRIKQYLLAAFDPVSRKGRSLVPVTQPKTFTTIAHLRKKWTRSVTRMIGCSPELNRARFLFASAGSVYLGEERNVSSSATAGKAGKSKNSLGKRSKVDIILDKVVSQADEFEIRRDKDENPGRRSHT